MKKLFIVITAIIFGTAIQAQDIYVGASGDYHFPHSGDAQTAGSLIAGMGFAAGPISVGAEAETGAHLFGDNTYNTARVRFWASYDWADYTFHGAGGVTEYYFDDSNSGGYNFGFGIARGITDTLDLRGELIRDIMNDTFTAAVTTTRIGVIYNF